MPTVSAKQYGFMQARAHGASSSSDGPSKEVAKKFIEETPPEKREKFAKVLAKKRYGHKSGSSKANTPNRRRYGK